jgi:hypothetical protein
MLLAKIRDCLKKQACREAKRKAMTSQAKWQVDGKRRI